MRFGEGPPRRSSRRTVQNAVAIAAVPNRNAPALIAAIAPSGPGADLLLFFCLVSGPMWFFIGLLFLANASFNNLGFPLLSTVFNWGRATIGTMPLAVIGARYAGPEGAIAAIGAGAFLFGTAAIATAFWTMRRLEARGAP